MIALALTLALVVGQARPPAEDPGFADIWVEMQPRFEAEGITRGMAYSAYLWAEGQYHIGRCRAFLSSEDVQFWRGWWDDTPLPKTQLGQAMLAIGEDGYTRGLEDALAEPLTGAQCQRVTSSWFDDMRSAIAAARD